MLQMHSGIQSCSHTNTYSEAWTNAIEMISQALPISGAAHYNYSPTRTFHNCHIWKQTLCATELDDLQLHDIAVACIWSIHILSRWRDDIQMAVNEGMDYVQYSNTLLPSAKNDVEKIAMQLIHFQKLEMPVSPL